MVVIFWIHPDPRVTLRVLDSVRLNNQLREAVMLREGKINAKHPAAVMWQGFDDYLDYFISLNRLVMAGQTADLPGTDVAKPGWSTSKHLILSHRARLIKKEPAHYEPLFGGKLPDVYREWGYVWPGQMTAQEIDSQPLDKVAAVLKDEGPACHCGAVPAKYAGKCFRHRDKTVARTICEGTKKSGARCGNKAIFGELMCGVHKS